MLFVPSDPSMQCASDLAPPSVRWLAMLLLGLIAVLIGACACCCICYIVLDIDLTCVSETVCVCVHWVVSGSTLLPRWYPGITICYVSVMCAHPNA